MDRADVRLQAAGRPERHAFAVAAPSAPYRDPAYFAPDWGDSEKQDLRNFGKLARTAPPHAHDAQISNGPIRASIRVREVPIQQCQRLTSHSTQLWS